MTFGMILLVLILACSVAGSLIAQGNTPDYYVQTYPDWHGTILKLKLDDIFASWYFIALMALLCLNLTLCSLIRVRNVVKASRAAGANAARRESKVQLTDQGMQKLKTFLEVRHFRRQTIEDKTV
jgi:cytochrome c biogenesis protein